MPQNAASGRWLRVPERLIDDPRTGRDEIAVLAALLRYPDASAPCHPPHPLLPQPPPAWPGRESGSPTSTLSATPNISSVLAGPTATATSITKRRGGLGCSTPPSASAAPSASVAPIASVAPVTAAMAQAARGRGV